MCWTVGIDEPVFFICDLLKEKHQFYIEEETKHIITYNLRWLLLLKANQQYWESESWSTCGFCLPQQDSVLISFSL